MIRRTDPVILWIAYRCPVGIDSLLCLLRAVRYQQRARGNAAARRALGTGGYDEQHHQDS